MRREAKVDTWTVPLALRATARLRSRIAVPQVVT